MSEPNKKSFNLIDEPWIPVAAEKELRSLRAIFSGTPPRDLSGNPVEKIVLFRFLLSIAHASVTIADTDAWRQLTPQQLAESACKYLDEHHELFDLYDPEKPFLQFPKLAKMGKIEDCSTLKAEVATGNRSVLTAWSQAKNNTSIEKAMTLLCSCGYGRGGKKYDSSIVLTKGYIKGKTGKAGTLLGSYGYLHAYMKGEDLWESLKFNMFTEEEIKALKWYPAGMGRPCWENMPAGEDDLRAKEYRNSYFGRIFPLDKFLLFKDNGVIKTDGISYLDSRENIPEPAITVFQDGKDYKTIWAKTDKRPWRQLTALLSFLGDRSKYPYTISLALQKLRGCPRKTITVWFGGAEVSSNSGEQYFSGKNDYIESVFSFPAEHMGSQEFSRFEDIMLKTEKTAKSLYVSVAEYHKQMNNDLGADHASRATTLFWEQMEKRAQIIIDIAFSENFSEEMEEAEIAEWRKLVYRIYDEICPHSTARQMSAYVQANPRYRKAEKEKNKEKNKEKTQNKNDTETKRSKAWKTNEMQQDLLPL